MIQGSSNSCFPSVPQGLSIYGVSDHQDAVSTSTQAYTSILDTHSTSFLQNLSILRGKIHQVQYLASMFFPSRHIQHSESMTVAVASMGTLIQEIIVTASSMMFACQQMSLGAEERPSRNELHHHGHGHDHDENRHPRVKLSEVPRVAQQNYGADDVTAFGEDRGQGFYANDVLDNNWYGDSYSTNNCSTNDNNIRTSTIVTVSNHNIYQVGIGTRELLLSQKDEPNIGELEKFTPRNYDIVELDAADLLAKYTHYCQVCGKGFKRDANLRMHMRAHGDEFKSNAALTNPLKNKSVATSGSKLDDHQEGLTKLPRKYSCPQEGCRWNKKHAKFQPLKSMICVKNHYKRTHCPKMYVCNRCNRKEFSVLSDLRTHEKHCGDVKWMCSCGTTFSRKDKLMGHVALFAGHAPAISSLAKMGKAD